MLMLCCKCKVKKSHNFTVQLQVEECLEFLKSACALNFNTSAHNEKSDYLQSHSPTWRGPKDAVQRGRIGRPPDFNSALIRPPAAKIYAVHGVILTSSWGSRGGSGISKSGGISADLGRRSRRGDGDEDRGRPSFLSLTPKLHSK